MGSDGQWMKEKRRRGSSGSGWQEGERGTLLFPLRGIALQLTHQYRASPFFELELLLRGLLMCLMQNRARKAERPREVTVQWRMQVAHSRCCWTLSHASRPYPCCCSSSARTTCLTLMLSLACCTTLRKTCSSKQLEGKAAAAPAPAPVPPVPAPAAVFCP